MVQIHVVGLIVLSLLMGLIGLVLGGYLMRCRCEAQFQAVFERAIHKVRQRVRQRP